MIVISTLNHLEIGEIVEGDYKWHEGDDYIPVTFRVIDIATMADWIAYRESINSPMKENEDLSCVKYYKVITD